MLSFRPISPEEFDKLKPLFASDDGSFNVELWEKYRAKRLKGFTNKECQTYVIDEDGEFIGEITVNFINHTLVTETIPHKRVYLEAFRVIKPRRGHGLGEKLLQFVLDSLVKEGYTEFTIGVEEGNLVAKHIYNVFGFTEAIDYGRGDEFDPTDYTLYLKRQNSEQTNDR